MKPIAEIRKEIRVARRAIGPQVRERNSSRICRRVSQLDSFKSATHIATYLAFDGEADPHELMGLAVDQGKRIYLPIIIGKSKPLWFAPWTPATLMLRNRFNILEPHVDPTEWITADRLDFVVNPLVGFDERCNRIGVGGGFYDRTFAFLNEPEHIKKVQLVGFAFELQKLDSIEPQPWDVRLDAVVSEAKIYR